VSVSTSQEKDPIVWKVHYCFTMQWRDLKVAEMGKKNIRYDSRYQGEGVET